MRECKTKARWKPWNDHNNRPSSMEERAPLTWWNALSTFQKLKRGARLWKPTVVSAGTVTVDSHAVGVKPHIRWLLAACWLSHAVGIVWIYWAASKSPKHLVDEISFMWTMSLQKGSKCPALIYWMHGELSHLDRELKGLAQHGPTFRKGRSPLVHSGFDAKLSSGQREVIQLLNEQLSIPPSECLVWTNRCPGLKSETEMESTLMEMTV